MAKAMFGKMSTSIKGSIDWICFPGTLLGIHPSQDWELACLQEINLPPKISFYSSQCLKLHNSSEQKTIGA